jgi:hypothetical protein
MLMLYLLLLLLLVLARLYVAGRVVLLEKRFVRIAQTARDLANPPGPRQPVHPRLDAYAYAKQQYLLGEMTAKRDQAEARYEAWQARSEKLAKLMKSIRAWKGRSVPYLFGAVDAVLVLVTLALVGVLEAPALTQALASLWNG